MALQVPWVCVLNLRKPYGIVGLGDSSYPRFCAAVDIYETLLLDRGAGPIGSSSISDQI